MKRQCYETDEDTRLDCTPHAAPEFATSHVDSSPASRTNSGSTLLLEALKEEIFQLEVDRKQGQISQQEYEKAKAALDQTLERALKRKSSA